MLRAYVRTVVLNARSYTVVSSAGGREAACDGNQSQQPGQDHHFLGSYVCTELDLLPAHDLGRLNQGRRWPVRARSDVAPGRCRTGNPVCVPTECARPRLAVAPVAVSRHWLLPASHIRLYHLSDRLVDRSGRPLTPTAG